MQHRPSLKTLLLSSLTTTLIIAPSLNSSASIIEEKASETNVTTLTRMRPLNPPILGDFRTPAPPKLGVKSVPLAGEATNDTVDAFIEQLMASRNIPGLSLAVVQDGMLIKAQGYGYLNIENNVRTSPSSVFPLASVSKPFTAMGIMLLVQDGAIALDHPISAYLPNIPDHWQAITVRQLLSHTAGLSEEVYASRFRTLKTPSKFWAEAAEEPLDFNPGEAWMYSNTGYNLAAMLISEVTGQSFAEFMELRLFGPLGMNHTDVISDNYAFSNRATGYWWVRNQLQIYPIDVLTPNIIPILSGAGSMTSTVLDLARWEIAFHKGQVLTPDLQSEMYEPVTMNSGRRFDYGLGWFLDDVNGRRMISHGGSLPGFSTSIARFVDDRLTVIILANDDDEDGDELATKIAERYIPSLMVDHGAEAIADPNPALTDQLLRYIHNEEGAIAPTPEWEIALTTPRGQYVWARLQDYIHQIDIEALELLEAIDDVNGTRYRYRGVTESTRPILEFVVTPEEQLMVVRLEREESI